LGIPFFDFEAAGRLVFFDFTEAYDSAGPAGVVNLWQDHARRQERDVVWGTASHRLSDWWTTPWDFIQLEKRVDAALQTLPIVS
jgi:hypothetical protein